MDQDDPTPDDFDTPWKTALTRYLPEFMAFYFPEAYAAIDWRQPHRFLDQELAQVVRDAGLGKRLVDRLVEVATLASGPQGAPRFGGQIPNLSPCPQLPPVRSVSSPGGNAGGAGGRAGALASAQKGTAQKGTAQKGTDLFSAGK